MMDLDKTCSTKLTKIICTIGPSVNESIVEMIDNGMSILRINLSHIKSESELNAIFTEINRVRETGERFFGVALDTQGPEIRLLIEKVGYISKGQILTFTNDIHKKCFGYMNFPNLDKIKVGFEMKIDDGGLKVEVKKIEDNVLHCVALCDHFLEQNKGVAFPGIDLGVPFLSKMDLRYLKMGLDNEIDFIFLSFVSKKSDIAIIRELIGANGALIISKIESKIGMLNLDEIIDVSDGIMVARGDLAAEVDLNKIVIAQKLIVNKCKEKQKPVIVATQMMESMTVNSIPTRAEVSDVSNAIFDSVDCVMLSGETSIGNYPIKCVESMSKIAIASENYSRILEMRNIENNKVITLLQNKDIKYIILMVVNEDDIFDVYHRNIWAPVIVVSQDIKLLKRLSLFRGLIPYKISFNAMISDPNSYKNYVNDIVSFLKIKFGAQTNDLAIIYCKRSENEKDIHEIRI